MLSLFVAMIVKLPDCNLSGHMCVRFFFRRRMKRSFSEYVCSHNRSSCAVKVMEDAVFALYALLCTPVVVKKLVQRPSALDSQVTLSEHLNKSGFRLLDSFLRGVPTGVVSVCPQQISCALVFQDCNACSCVGLYGEQSVVVPSLNILQPVRKPVGSLTIFPERDFAPVNGVPHGECGLISCATESSRVSRDQVLAAGHRIFKLVAA